MPEDKNAERRRYQRLERRDEVQVKEYSYPERGRYQRARIIDISGGGLQLECAQFFPVGCQLKIEMNFTGWQRFTPSFLKHFGEAARRPLVVLAEVIRCTCLVAGHRYEVAASFTGIDESHQKALARFIRAEITKKG
jgi:hypothetical protein